MNKDITEERFLKEERILKMNFWHPQYKYQVLEWLREPRGGRG